MDWWGELPRTLEHPSEGIELVQCSTARTKTALFLLNPRFYHRPDSPLLYPGIDFSGKAEECDPPIVGTHPPVPLLKKGDHHPFCPVQRHCPRPPCNVTEACQPRQPHHIQGLEVLRADLIHPDALPLRSLQTTSVTSAWVMDESTPESSISASSMEGVSV